MLITMRKAAKTAMLTPTVNIAPPVCRPATPIPGQGCVGGDQVSALPG